MEIIWETWSRRRHNWDRSGCDFAQIIKRLCSVLPGLHFGWVMLLRWPRAILAWLEPPRRLLTRMLIRWRPFSGGDLLLQTSLYGHSPPPKLEISTQSKNVLHKRIFPLSRTWSVGENDWALGWDKHTCCTEAAPCSNLVLKMPKWLKTLKVAYRGGT